MKVVKPEFEQRKAGELPIGAHCIHVGASCRRVRGRGSKRIWLLDETSLEVFPVEDTETITVVENVAGRGALKTVGGGVLVAIEEDTPGEENIISYWITSGKEPDTNPAGIQCTNVDNGYVHTFAADTIVDFYPYAHVQLGWKEEQRHTVD